MKHLILQLGMILSSSVAFGSGITIGNGGNSCALDFAQKGRVIYNVILDNDFYKSKLNFKKLDHAINNTPILIVEAKLNDKNGGLVPAKNDGQGKIFLSQEDWCARGNFISNQFAIILHEYLGVSHPGKDLQYQLSGSLYAQTSLVDLDFINFQSTGSDYKTKTITFTHVLQSSGQTITIETKAIKEFFNLIHVSESYRHGVRATIICEKDHERVELTSIYAKYDGQSVPQWFYTERPLSTYAFNSPSTCAALVNRAAFLGAEDLKITFGLNSLTLLNFY